jgi:hypothetical protein
MRKKGRTADDADDEAYGYWPRETLIEMEQRFRERVQQVLDEQDAATECEPARDADLPQDGPAMGG